MLHFCCPLFADNFSSELYSPEYPHSDAHRFRLAQVEHAHHGFLFTLPYPFNHNPRVSYGEYMPFNFVDDLLDAIHEHYIPYKGITALHLNVFLLSGSGKMRWGQALKNFEALREFVAYGRTPSPDCVNMLPILSVLGFRPTGGRPPQAPSLACIRFIGDGVILGTQGIADAAKSLESRGRQGYKLEVLHLTFLVMDSDINPPPLNLAVWENKFQVALNTFTNVAAKFSYTFRVKNM